MAIAEGGIRESIEHGRNGLLVEGDDPVALGKSVARYVDDLELARDEGLRARDHVFGIGASKPSIDRLEANLIETAQMGKQARHGSAIEGGRAAGVVRSSRTGSSRYRAGKLIAISIIGSLRQIPRG